MARLKAAIAAQQKQGRPEVALPAMPNMPETARRRAFDGLHRRLVAPQVETRAQQALTQSKAALDAQREAASLRISQALGLSAPDRAVLAGGALPAAPKGYVPVIFASSSMPIAELRAYAAQLELVGGVIAFRGMPGGLRWVAPMAKLSAQILRQDPGCEGPACAMRNVQVIIDPLVFRQHGVTRVPAFTMVQGDPTQPYCERDEGSSTGSQTVFGDAALTGLLAEYARLGGKEEVRDAQTRLERR
ncbi:MAG: conjugal transfer protein TrbC [Sphingomonadales bacterium]|nr:conjugal transfer protein TrbC [Sphingomonadales bacterium]MDE2169379.1 conjugal transfer protein TrbC [Sphingomonadales bacterium]